MNYTMSPEEFDRLKTGGEKNVRRAFRRGIYVSSFVAVFIFSVVMLASAVSREACRDDESVITAMVACMKAPALTCTYTPQQLREAEGARRRYIDNCKKEDQT